MEQMTKFKFEEKIVDVSFENWQKKRNFLVGFCEKWNVVIIPILQENTDYLETFKNLVEAVIGDCKWYYDYIHVHCLTKNFELIPINDLVEFSDLNSLVKKFFFSNLISSFF